MHSQYAFGVKLYAFDRQRAMAQRHDGAGLAGIGNAVRAETSSSAGKSLSSTISE